MPEPQALAALLPELTAVLAHAPCVLLEAPPGAGKTTRVPLAVYQAPWLAKHKVLMLEPRRLAARSAARYMASLLGESVGQTVGYRVRLESKIGPQTRIEVVTEGILTRMLQDDPTLEGYGLVIFDEFHERSLQADLGLALCREAQQVLRPDLRLLIMSATLQSDRLANLLDQAPILRAQGQQFPVTVQYAPVPVNTRPEAHMSAMVRKVLAEESGSVLVFLPGTGEIRRVAEHLQGLPEHILIAPLYGDLSPAEQDAAIQPAPTGQRKVVLATNVAETSLTIEGIRVVIDSGLERTPIFDPVSGLTRLETVRISKASATQRQGRAGRLEPGICLRLWREDETALLATEIPPEILTADLAPLALELAQWGAPTPGDLAWLDPPPPQAWEQAQTLLHSLGAITSEGKITPHGKALVRLPIHPRLGHMVVKAQTLKLGGLACTVAALLSERDPLGHLRESDLSLRVHALQGRRDLPGGRRQTLLKAADQIGRSLNLKPAFAPLEELGLLLGLAYPDRLAQRRPGGEPRYLLANGRGVILDRGDSLGSSPWLAVAHLDGHPREAKVFLASPLTEEQLLQLTADQSERVTDVSFDAKTGRVQARELTRYGALTLREQHILKPEGELLTRVLVTALQSQGVARLPWSKAQMQLRDRVQFLRRHQGETWPALDDETLTETLGDWLAPFLTGLRRPDAVDAQILQQGLEYAIGYGQLAQLEALAPTHWTVPTGSRIALDYSGSEPVLAVRLQELFGTLDTPRLIQGQVPVLIHLLSPAQRPVQVTRDLASFWRETYPEVKKELKGRYPKHYWPDNPLEAEPIRGVKRRPASS